MTPEARRQLRSFLAGETKFEGLGKEARAYVRHADLQGVWWSGAIELIRIWVEETNDG